MFRDGKKSSENIKEYTELIVGYPVAPLRVCNVSKKTYQVGTKRVSALDCIRRDRVSWPDDWRSAWRQCSQLSNRAYMTRKWWKGGRGGGTKDHRILYIFMPRMLHINYDQSNPDNSVMRFVGQNAAISTNDWCHVLLSISFWSALGNMVIGSQNRHCRRLVKNIWAPISNTYSPVPRDQSANKRYQ